jgi:hypothetical protein
MSAADVQAFLNQRGAACRIGPDGSACLKDYRVTTTDRPATTWCTGAYAGRTSETAADVITRVSLACGVSPRVLLVLLQKEQSLVTTTSPTATRYRSATGYGCPDTAPCDAQYYGFFNQVYQAASRFRQYALTPNLWRHKARATNTILYHPDATCGSSQVFIHNQATAGLYNYTPYQPNAAALAAGYGTGDACSAYGNRNFYNYYFDWFGDPTGVPPIGSLDSVTGTNTGLTFRGWALDPDTSDPIPVHVYVDGAAVSVLADVSRPDIAAAFGKGDRHGFDVTLPKTPGPHSVCVHAINADPGRNTLLGCRTAVVPDAAPIGVVDSVTTTASSITVAGWTLDPDTTAPIAAHVYVDGVGVAIQANQPRPDIGRAYGKGDLHGFSHTVTVAAGRHDVCVHGIGSVTGGANTLLACRSVVAQASQAPPTGVIDTVATSPAGVTVTGWTLDPDTTDPTDVHVYIDGIGTSIRADQSRPDIAAAFGKGDRHGFTHTRQLSPGRHSMCVYAINTGPGANTLLGCRDLTISNAAPIGSLDAVTVASGSLTVSGWTLDPDTNDSIEAHVYVDGVGTALRADLSRPDVAAAYGRGDRHGFGHTVPATAGSHQVCVFGIDATGGTNPVLGCRQVVVPA